MFSFNINMLMCVAVYVMEKPVRLSSADLRQYRVVLLSHRDSPDDDVSDPVQEGVGGGVGGAGLGVHGDHAREGELRHCQGLGGAENNKQKNQRGASQKFSKCFFPVSMPPQ